MSKLAEVRFGTAQEIRVAQRWLHLQRHYTLGEGERLVKGGKYDDYDFTLLDDRDRIKCYLEIKVRRTPFAKYGDAMFPERKHDFAIVALEAEGHEFWGVTEYKCGTLAEVLLSVNPAFRKDVQRWDRLDKPGLPHVFYRKAQMTILAGERE